RAAEDKKTASDLLPKVISMLDRLAKKNVIHKNKAANNKSKLTKFVNGLK
ncbi:MAG: 30S ribosomal protein S20, partial [Pedobacter sp.]